MTSRPNALLLSLGVGMGVLAGGCGTKVESGQNAEKGRLMMAPMLVFPIAYGFDALTGGATMRVVAYTINLAIKPWSAWDAFSNAVPPAPATPPPAKPTPAAPAPSAKPSPLPSPSSAITPTPAASASPGR